MPWASKWFSASVKPPSVSASRWRDRRAAKPAGVLMPVPTAVPPRASSRTRGSVAVDPRAGERDGPGVAAELLPERHRGGVHQVGAARLHRACGTPPPAGQGVVEQGERGVERPRSSSTAATWIALGKVSLDDWLALTTSLGWHSTPARRGERGDHLVDVHVGAGARAGLEDVDRELVVVLARRRSRPPRPRSRRAARRVITPSSALARAAAALIRASAWTRAAGSGRPLIGKLSTARWVCARHRASAGTSTSPMESCSVRVSGGLMLRRYPARGRPARPT